MLQPPALLLSLILASAYAVGFYLWQGKGLRDLLVFWLASLAGFALGQVAGQMLSVVHWTIGEVRVAESTLVAFTFLLLVKWLRPESKKP